MTAAVIFDLDGVLMDSEQRWNAAKEELVRESGGRWRDDAPTVMIGMSSRESGPRDHRPRRRGPFPTSAWRRRGGWRGALALAAVRVPVVGDVTPAVVEQAAATPPRGPA